MLSRSETIKDFYIPNLLTMLEGIETGAVTGKVNKYTAKMPVTQYVRNEDLSMFNAMASYFSQQIVYMNSGKQINAEEMRILSQSLPNAELTTAENKKRLQQFLEITNRSYNNYTTRNGISIAGGTSVNGVGNVGSISDIILEGSVDGIEWSVTED